MSILMEQGQILKSFVFLWCRIDYERPKEWTIEDPAMGDARLLPKAVHGGLDRNE